MDQEKRNGIILFVTHSQFQLKQLCLDLISQYIKCIEKEDVSLHPEIEKQFITECKRILAKEIARMQQLNPEEVYIFLESFDVKQYFGLTK